MIMNESIILIDNTYIDLSIIQHANNLTRLE